ncbi:hypothetical protein pEaSNUABM29_00249 [Erwinia phage pEa_SNUABM_29]|nr:hypothetical protein pEaSNUABM29_00249 [Erwinia phage pEa_SNUABM_29]
MRGIMTIVVAGLFFTASAVASTNVTDLLLDKPYQYNPPSFEVCAGDSNACEEVQRHDEYILIHAKGGATCPAGYYFVLDSKAQEILPVNTVTCDPTLKATLAYNQKTKKRLLVIEQEGRIQGSVTLDQ